MIGRVGVRKREKGRVGEKEPGGKGGSKGRQTHV